MGTINPAFQLQTLDGKVARHFIVKDQRITSRSGVHPEPAFAIAFKDAAYGFVTMQAKNKQLAFMTGIQDKSIQIKGN
ncbi:helicase, partial [Pseudomonas sp. AU8050]|nr:helicase [Pseudomonas sp. AU8050]